MRRCALAAALVVVAAAVALRGQARPASAPSTPVWLEQAARAGAEMRLDAGAALLARVFIEQPGDPEAWRARLPLARLLALGGDTAGALLQCQGLRNAVAADHPAQREALDLASVLARRLRTGLTPMYFSQAALAGPRGIPAMNEPTAVALDLKGRYLAVDAGAGRAYLVTGDTATMVGAAEQIDAGTLLPDGTTVLASKNGIATGSGKPVLYSTTVQNRPRPLRKIRSLASTSTGDLLVADRDADGLLRCKAGTTTCATWGPPGRVWTVKVGVLDSVYLLDDRQETVRALDASGRLVAAAGGAQAAPDRLQGLVDIAVDAAYGVYLLDKDKRIHVLLLHAAAAGKPAALDRLATYLLPADEPRAIKYPASLVVFPDGSVLVAGRSTARFLRLQ